MRSVAGIGLIIAFAGCTDPSLAVRSSTPDTLIVPAQTASPEPSRPPPTPYPTIGPLPSDIDPDIRYAIENRRMYRLRFDLEYVLQIASDREAYDTLGFPVSKEEWAQMGRDHAEQERIIRVVMSYGPKPEEWAGLYIDREEMPGVVVALFTEDVAGHEAAIRTKLGETELFATRQVKYGKPELDAIKERISDDMSAPWILEIPAIVTSVGVHISGNVVHVGVSSAVPDAAEIIAGHYDLGDRIRVESDGTGVMLIPWGTVAGTVTLPGGKPYKAPRSLPVSLGSGGPGDSLGTCNGSDMGYGVGSDGRFEYPCQIGRRTIRIEVPTEEDGEWRTIGQGTVVVEERKTARLNIELDARP